MKNHKNADIYDFSDYAEEITGEDLIKINGGSSSCNGSGPGNGGSSAASGGSGSKGSGSSSIGASSGSCGGSTPVSEMKTSTKGIDFIISYEGFSSNIYDAKKSNNYLSGISTYKDGDWTIGYGHKLTQQEFEGKVFENGIDKTVAKQIRVKDLSWVEEGIQKNFNGKLTQQQFDALVSLGINIGRSGLVNSEPFNDAETRITDITKIKKDFIQYNKGYNSDTKKLEYMLGLERRRYDEVEMYLYGDYIRNDDLTLDKPVF